MKLSVSVMNQFESNCSAPGHRHLHVQRASHMWLFSLHHVLSRSHGSLKRSFADARSSGSHLNILFANARNISRSSGDTASSLKLRISSNLPLVGFDTASCIKSLLYSGFALSRKFLGAGPKISLIWRRRSAIVDALLPRSVCLKRRLSCSIFHNCGRHVSVLCC
jgi:hypothetical protein